MEAIRNSCDTSLQNIVDAKMQKHATSLWSGPLYFFHLMRQLTNVDDRALHAITTELSTMKVTNYEGQSMISFVLLI